VPLHCASASASDTPRRQPKGIHLTFSANPCHGRVSMELSMPCTDDVRISLHDAQGREVREIHQGSLTGGIHQFEWDGRNSQGRPAPAGTYFARISRAESVTSQRLVLMR